MYKKKSMYMPQFKNTLMLKNAKRITIVTSKITNGRSP